jgi:hypothetical protein
LLDCLAYARLSHPAKALLFEVARQFVRDNNGRMLLSRAHMAKRNWKSADTISKQFKRLKRVVKRQRTILGIVIREIQCKMPNSPIDSAKARTALNMWLERAERIRTQQRQG